METTDPGAMLAAVTARLDRLEAESAIRIVMADDMRIHRLQTENLFGRPADRWDDPAPVPVPPRHDRGE